MIRNNNTTVDGAPFHETTIREVWKKADPTVALIFEKDPNVIRKDICGDRIDFSEYGKSTEHGWEIDHIKPVAAGGGDKLDNLQPLYWRTNRTKGDTYPWKPEPGKTGSGLIGRVRS